MSSSNVLLIDDNTHQHELFDCYAATANTINLMSALDVDEGMVTMMDKCPDVILLDNRLVEVENFKESVPELRAFGFTGPIVVISSDISSITKDEMDDYLVSGCIDKFDFDLGNFETKIVELMAA